MFTVGWETAPLYEREVCMKAVVKVDIVDGKCVVIYSDGSEQELYEYPSGEGGGGGAVLGTKHITHNGIYNASSDNLDGYSSVSVAVSTPSPIMGVKEITSNGTYDASQDDVEGYYRVIVDVEGGGETFDVMNYLNRICGRVEPSGNILMKGSYNLRAKLFENCTRLTGIKMKGSLSGDSVCAGCTNLKYAYGFSNGHIGQNGFQNCTNLEEFYMPNITSIYNVFAGAFSGCNKLRILDIGAAHLSKANTISSPVLETLIMRGTTIYNLASGVFTAGSSIASGGAGCDVYIPKTLYDALGTGGSDDYLTQSQWAALNNLGTITWHQIEGSQYVYNTMYASVLAELEMT